MSEQEFLYCLQLAIDRSSKKYVVPPAATRTTTYHDLGQVILHNDMSRTLSDPQNTMPWRRDPRMAIYRNIEDAPVDNGGQGNEGLRSFLVSLASEPEKLDQPATATFFAQEIAKRVFAFLMKEDAVADTSQTLTSIGADSLVAIEIRNWWKQTFGTEISVLELSDAGGSMEQLGALAAQRLKEKHLVK